MPALRPGMAPVEAPGWMGHTAQITADTAVAHITVNGIEFPTAEAMGYPTESIPQV